MSGQNQLECVSCGQSFDPEPYGGFCPNCDTPHPDYEVTESNGDSSAPENTDSNSQQDLIECWDCGAEVEATKQFCTSCGVDLDDEPEDVPPQPKLTDCPSCGADVDSSASFCPECGSELSEEDEGEEEDQDEELTECPDCGVSIDDESFCPNCGADLDEIRSQREPSDTNGEVGSSTGQPSLVIAGKTFRIEDGDTFGRKNEDSISALVDAAGGRDEVKRVSREHLEFNVSGNEVSVTDISTHGTDYNGNSIDGETVKLSDGDTLTLADVAEVEVDL